MRDETKHAWLFRSAQVLIVKAQPRYALTPDVIAEWDTDAPRHRLPKCQYHPRPISPAHFAEMISSPHHWSPSAVGLWCLPYIRQKNLPLGVTTLVEWTIPTIQKTATLLPLWHLACEAAITRLMYLCSLYPFLVGKGHSNVNKFLLPALHLRRKGDGCFLFVLSLSRLSWGPRFKQVFLCFRKSSSHVSC